MGWDKEQFRGEFSLFCERLGGFTEEENGKVRCVIPLEDVKFKHNKFMEQLTPRPIQPTELLWEIKRTSDSWKRGEITSEAAMSTIHNLLDWAESRLRRGGR